MARTNTNKRVQKGNVIRGNVRARLVRQKKGGGDQYQPLCACVYSVSSMTHLLKNVARAYNAVDVIILLANQMAQSSSMAGTIHFKSSARCLGWRLPFLTLVYKVHMEWKRVHYALGPKERERIEYDLVLWVNDHLVRHTETWNSACVRDPDLDTIDMVVYRNVLSTHLPKRLRALNARDHCYVWMGKHSVMYV